MTRDTNKELVNTLTVKIFLTAIEGVFFPWMLKPLETDDSYLKHT